MKLTKRNITLIAGIPLSFLFLYLAVRKVNIAEIIHLIAKTNYVFMIPAVFAFIIDFSLRAFRWKILISPLKKCRYMDLLSITFIGFFANGILPMRAGEIIRVLIVSEKEKISRASAAATLILERILDSFAILLLLSTTFFVFPYPENIKKIWIIGITLFAILLLLFYGLMFYRKRTLKLLNRFLKVLPGKFENKIEHLLESFIAGLEILKKTHHLIATILISLSVWLVDASFFFFVAKGMGIHQINYLGVIFIMSVIALGISVPSSPGYIGVYEYFGILACSVLGVAKSTALSFILLTHAIQFLLMTIIGTSFLAKEHISLIQLEKKAEKENQ